MLKRGLMLTAATAALVSGVAYADNFTDITTKVTQQIKTSTAADGSPGDILIESTGSVVVGVAGPAVEIDSANTVTNKGNISNTATTSAIGVQLDATAAGNGPGTGVTAFDSTGTIDLTGKGDTKTGILVGIANGDPTGIFNGDINLESGSSLKITGTSSDAIHIGSLTTWNGNLTMAGTISMAETGDTGTDKTGVLIGTDETNVATINGNVTLSQGGSLTVTGDGGTGIHLIENSVLNGTLEVDGTVSLSPTDPKSTTSGNVVGIKIEQNSTGDAITGDFIIGKEASITASGFSSEGVVLQGNLGGAFENSGNIAANGTIAASTTATNPVAGPGVAIAGSVGDGILNNGPTSSGDSATNANIGGNGLAPTFVISPVASGATPTADLHIGIFAGTLGTDSNAMSCALVSQMGACSFVNRGQILASPTNPNQISTTTMRIEGSGSFDTIFDGGFFNSGSITANASGDTKETTPGMTVQALSIGSGASIPLLFNSNQNSSHTGSITAAWGGNEIGGTAVAVHIDQGATLSTIVNQGTISAQASITDTTVTSLTARAIWDESGTLTRVDNYDAISAVATILDNKGQTAIALDMGAATTDTVVNNYGIIVGDVVLGNAADQVTVSGTTNQNATINGDIEFGGTSNAGASDDSLDIKDFATVTGAITDRAAGRLDVLVESGGKLTLTNDSIDPAERFTANNFTIQSGATLITTLSQTYNLAANPTAGGIITTTGPANLQTGSLMSLGFGSFVIVPGQQSIFTLIDAPLGQLNIADLTSLQTQICNNVPFLFNNTPSCLTEQDVNSRSQLQLALDPKTAQELGLHGYALKMFPFANEALANDDQLGAAVISAGLPVNGVPLTTEEGNALYQTVYSQFAPNVTGASRALAIALTDQASGPVAARQRELRMYAAQPGETTLWGQQFAVNLNQDPSANTIGYRDSGYGLAMGLDGGNPADGRYGGALTFYSGDITEKDPLTSKTNTLWAMLSGYTDWRGKGFFFDTQVNAGIGKLDGKRAITVGGVSRTAEGKRPALLGSIGATTGVILTSGSTVFTPLMSVDGLAMREDGYTEHGGGDPNSGDGFDLNIKSTYYQSLRGFLGADIRQDINLGEFYLQPEARAGYRYDFANGAEKLKGNFVSEPLSGFSLTGPDPARGNAVLGGSLSATTGAWSIGVHYDYIRGDDGSVSQAGTLTLLGRI